MRDLDRTYEDTWDRRLINLGCLSYKEYLNSDHWKSVKLKASKRPSYQKCEFCESCDIELHHTTYKWILTPFELRSIISLCRKHHQEVHDLSKQTGKSVRVASNTLRRKYKGNCFIPNRVKNV
jgi:hypothetical protein